MSNTVSNSWNRGNKPLPGVPSLGYPHLTMEWNQPDDDSNHEEILSPTMDFPMKGQAVTILVNTEAIPVAGDIAVNIYGAASNHSTISQWEIMDTVTITNANLTNTTYAHVYDVDAKGIAPYMKIGLNPDADPGVVDIKVGVITGAG